MSFFPFAKSVESYNQIITSTLATGQIFKSLTKLEKGLRCHSYHDSFIDLFFTKYLAVDTLERTSWELEQHCSKFPYIGELLSKWSPNYFVPFSNLIVHCLDNNLSKLIHQSLKRIHDNTISASRLWQIADIFFLRQRQEKADSLYQILKRKTLEQSEDYLYSALAEYRLGNGPRCVSLLEKGLVLYPQDELLKKTYLQFSVEFRSIERLILFLGKQQSSQHSVCKSLLEDENLSFSIKVQVIQFCLENQFFDLLDRTSEFLQMDSVTSLELWQLADIFILKGRKQDADTIYSRLARMEAVHPSDYLYSALANRRLDNVSICYEIFEKGIKNYPNEEFLKSFYIQTCAEHLNYSRYFEFMQQFLQKDESSTSSLMDFYKTVIKTDSRWSFLITYKEIEKLCLPKDFELLKLLFLEELKENRIPIENAKQLIFFAKFLDVETNFVLAILENLKKSFELFYEDSQKFIAILEILTLLTPPIIPYYAVDPNKVVMEFIDNCKRLAENCTTLDSPIKNCSIEWVPWQYLFCYATPVHYPLAMKAFERFVFATWPQLNYCAPHVSERFQYPSQSKLKIKIGFVSHGSMPMLSGLLRQLDKEIFETVFLHNGSVGNSLTAKSWVTSASKIVEYSNTDSFSAIQTIAAEKLDIIISAPSTPDIFFPMMARLAHLQMILLEPNWTNGMANTDYYISWRPAEPAKLEDFYQTAVTYLEHPPYWIERPHHLSKTVLKDHDAFRKEILKIGSEKHIYLCANTPPKINPLMDTIFAELLEADPTGIIVILRGNYPPSRNIKLRLQEKLGKNFERLLFLPGLSQEDAHCLLMSADCCLDSFPLCGMSSSFDAAMLGVPLVTLPTEIPFGKWTAAIYDYIGVSGLTARDQKEYIQLAVRLVTDPDWRKEKSRELKEKSSLFVESKIAFEEFQKFIIEAWNRKLLGLAPNHWSEGKWQSN